MFCYESSLNGFYEPKRASPDGCNIDDDKTLCNLLRVSSFYQPDPEYLSTKQQNGFTESMRSQLTEWMFGVSTIIPCIMNYHRFFLVSVPSFTLIYII